MFKIVENGGQKHVQIVEKDTTSDPLKGTTAVNYRWGQW